MQSSGLPERRDVANKSLHILLTRLSTKYPAAIEEAGERTRRTVGILWCCVNATVGIIRTTNPIELAFCNSEFMKPMCEAVWFEK